MLMTVFAARTVVVSSNAPGERDEKLHRGNDVMAQIAVINADKRDGRHDNRGKLKPSSNTSSNG
jgi:hypothetical protein